MSDLFVAFFLVFSNLESTDRTDCQQLQTARIVWGPKGVGFGGAGTGENRTGTGENYLGFG